MIAFLMIACVSCNSKYRAKVEEAISKGDYTEARVCAAKLGRDYEREEANEKITRAQVANLISLQGEEVAYALAQEENMTYLFFEAYMPRIQEFYVKSGEDKVLMLLSRVEFEHRPELEDSYADMGDNSYYNDAVFKYNSLLEQFIAYLCVTDKQKFANKLVNFLKPPVVEVEGKYETMLDYSIQKRVKQQYKL